MTMTTSQQQPHHQIHQQQQQQQQTSPQRKMSTTNTYDMTTVEECYDGTLCENSSRCIPHPFKEGSYMCDCTSVNHAVIAKGGSIASNQYAGLYCEHVATTYCQNDNSNSPSLHAFCTNGGECKTFVSKSQSHTGCKCPKGYEGEYCQYIEGSVPDWEFDKASLASLGYETGYGTLSEASSLGVGSIVGIVLGSVAGFVIIAGMLALFLWSGSTSSVIRGKKSGDATEMENESGSAFVGGMSVYKRKSSTRASFVTPENIDADGGVLMEAVKDSQHEQMEDIGSPRNEELTEVDLDELPSALEEGKEII